MDVVKVWVPLREYLSVQALYDAAIALHWKISERQNSTHLAFLKHQNTKTSTYKLSKNNWVIALSYLIFVIFFTRAKFLEDKIYTEKRQFSR